MSSSVANVRNMMENFTCAEGRELTSTLKGVDPDVEYEILHHWSPLDLAWSLLRSMSIKSGSACVEMYTVLLLILIPRRVYLCSTGWDGSWEGSV